MTRRSVMASVATAAAAESRPETLHLEDGHCTCTLGTCSRLPIYVVTIALLWLAAAAAATPVEGTAFFDSLPAALQPLQETEALLCLLNAARDSRSGHGKAPSALRADIHLATSAQEYSENLRGDLASKIGNSTVLATALKHRLRSRGVRYVEAATLIASGFSDATSVMAAWRKGLETAKIMFSPQYTHAGVGRVRMGSAGDLWAVDLIRHEEGESPPAKPCISPPGRASKSPSGPKDGSGITASAIVALSATDPEEMMAWRSVARMVCIVNRERERHGRLPVQVDRDVMRASRVHARQQALHGRMQPEGFKNGEGNDRSKSLSTPWSRLTAQFVRFWSVGENAARGYETEEDVVSGWMASDDHRRIILDVRFDRFGSSRAIAPDGAIYWTQTFAQFRPWGARHIKACPSELEQPPWA